MKKNFFKSNLAKSIALIVGGTAFAQLLNILLSPIITRIYSPEEFGVLTAYSSILIILSLGSFKYEMAIPIAKSDNNAINVLALGLIILSIYVFTLSFVFFFFGKKIINLFNVEELYDYIWLIPLGVLLTGLYKVFMQWNFRIKGYKVISKTTINQSIFGNGIKISAGLMGMGPIGLILGNIIGQSAGLTVLAKPLRKNSLLIKAINYKDIIWSFKRYKDFPIYNLPTYLLISLGNQTPIIFLTAYYGSAVVGFYGLAYTIVRLPMDLIGKSVGNVFFAESAKIGKNNPKKIKNLSNTLIKKLILIAVIPLVFLLLLGPQLFSFVFGENWYEAGVYAQIISVMLFFTLIFAPVSRIYEIFEKQRIRFYIDVVRIIMVMLVFLNSWFFDFNSYLSVLLYSIVISISYFFVYICAQKTLNNEINTQKEK